MADKVITLQPKISRKQHPYASVIYLSQPAANNYQIIAGSSLGIDNCWELLKASVQLVTTADVANRVINVRLYHKEDEASGVCAGEYIASDNIAASSNKSIGLYRQADLSGITQNDDFTGVIYPGAWTIKGLDFIDVTFDADVAGDVASIFFMFRWLNWEFGMESSGVQYVPPIETKKWCLW